MCQRPQFHPQFTMSKHNKMQLNDSSLIIINIYIQYTVYIHIYIMHSSKHSQPCLLVRGLQSLSSVGHHVSRVEAGTEGRTGDLSVTPSWSSSLPAAEKKQPATFRATQVAQSVHTILIKLELAVTKTVGQTRRSYILNLNYFFSSIQLDCFIKWRRFRRNTKNLAQILQMAILKSRISKVQIFFYVWKHALAWIQHAIRKQNKKTMIIVYRYYHEQPYG